MTRVMVDPAKYDTTRGTLEVDGKHVIMCENCQYFLNLMRTVGPITGPKIPCRLCTREIQERTQPPGSAIRDLSVAQLQALAEVVESEQKRRAGHGRQSTQTDATIRALMRSK